MNDCLNGIDNYAEENDTDIIVYFGNIVRGYDDYIINECRKRKLRKNVLLFLSTRGGDPNAAYRISRCLQEAYNTRNNRSETYTKQSDNNKGEFKILIDGMCKSAGTLICIGADEVIMSGNAELGPIDVQLSKRDEVGERESGLTPMQAMNFLQTESTRLFKRHFLTLRFAEDTHFSTKMSAEVATNLTNGLLNPLYQQIDPIRLAEVDRSMRIAEQYGHRLENNNLKDEGIERLLASYPSHGFVIDRGEAREIFKKVNELPEELRNISDFFRAIVSEYLDGNKDPFVEFLSKERQDKKTKKGE